MRVEFHRQVASDVVRIMNYYEAVGGGKLAEEFYDELTLFFHRASEFPESYSVRPDNLRRVNLETFPFHFLYRVVGDRIRILVVRHHSRRQNLGINRR